MTEKEIFELQDFLPYLLNQAAENSSLVFQKAYKDKYGMLRTEWRVLFHLGNFGAMTATEISTRASIHKTKVSRAVQKLVEKRFVTRTRSEDDRRREVLTITSSGQSAYEDLRRVARDYDVALCAKFTKAEVDLLRSMLRRLAAME